MIKNGKFVATQFLSSFQGSHSKYYRTPLFDSPNILSLILDPLESACNCN